MTGDDARSVRPLVSDYNHLVSVGPGGDAESLNAFKARFARRVAEVAAGFTEAHQRLAEQALIDLGAEPSLVGTPVTAAIQPTQGMVAVEGAPDQAGFTIWRFDEGRWRRQHGPGESISACVVSSVPGDKKPRLGTGPATLEEFKVAVWEVGQQIKQDHQWCSAYDNLLTEFGISDPNPWPDLSRWRSAKIKGEEGREKLPPGSILGVTKGDWGIFCKRPDGTWERLAGTRPLAAGTMLLLGRHGVIHYGARLAEFIPGSTVRGRHLYLPR
jgi:hypothetical protein